MFPMRECVLLCHLYKSSFDLMTAQFVLNKLIIGPRSLVVHIMYHNLKQTGETRSS